MTIGSQDDELNALAPGKQKLGVYDHRIQLLISDSLKLAELQQAKAALPDKVARNLPPVQRPGTSRPAGAQDSEQIQALTRQLNETGDLKVAQRLYALQQQRRAS